MSSASNRKIRLSTALMPSVTLRNVSDASKCEHSMRMTLIRMHTLMKLSKRCLCTMRNTRRRRRRSRGRLSGCVGASGRRSSLKRSISRVDCTQRYWSSESVSPRPSHSSLNAK